MVLLRFLINNCWVCFLSRPLLLRRVRPIVVLPFSIERPFFFNLNYLSCYSFSLFSFQRTLVGSSGFEPPTSCLSGMRSNHLSYEPICDSPGLFSPSFPVSIHSRGCGGDDGIRTHDPLLAGQVLSQLSYTPMFPGSHRLFSLFQRSFLIPENRTTDNPFLSSLPLGFVPISQTFSQTSFICFRSP